MSDIVRNQIKQSLNLFILRNGKQIKEVQDRDIAEDLGANNLHLISWYQLYIYDNCVKILWLLNKRIGQVHMANAWQMAQR